MSVTHITVEEARQLREKANKQIQLAEALRRLHDNQDFRLVFVQNYLQEEPIRLVHMLADGNTIYGQNPEAQERDNKEQMIGVARLSSYFRRIYTIAEGAQKTLNDLDEAERHPYVDEEE